MTYVRPQETQSSSQPADGARLWRAGRVLLAAMLALGGACSDAAAPSADVTEIAPEATDAGEARALLRAAQAPFERFAARVELEEQAGQADEEAIPPNDLARWKPELTASLDTELRSVDGALVSSSTLRPQLPAEVRLPQRAHDAFRVASAGLAVDVRLQGASHAEVEVVDGIAVYPGALPGADVLHRVGAEGTEDFVSFHVPPERPELRYEVTLSPEVAGLRLFGNMLELLDADGAPRLRVDAPWGLDANGERFDARLAVPDCAYDTDPRGPWDRPTTEPGARTCTVVVSWSDAVVYPAVVDPTWVATGTLFENFWPTMSLVQLDDGRVLLPGWHAVGSALWHPVTGTWSVTGGVDFFATHWTATAVRVRGNRVFLAGGQNGDGLTSSTPQPFSALYDPATGVWTRRANIPSSRTRQSMITLPDGRAAIVGGYVHAAVTITGQVLAYDPDTNAWAELAARPLPIRDHKLADLGGGRYFSHGSLWGGAGCHQVDGRSYIYDANTNSWSGAGAMVVPRGHTHATLMSDGRVFVPGSETCGGTAEIWNPATNTFTQVNHAQVGYGSDRVRTLSYGNYVVILPSTDTSAVYRYNITTNAYEGARPTLAYARWVINSIRLADGRFFALHANRGVSITTMPPEISTPTAGSTVTTRTPTVTGTCIPGATVTVRTPGGTSVCSATCTAAGAFECVSTTLPYGSNTIRATQQISGTTSGASDDRTFTVAPPPPAISTPTQGSSTTNRAPTFTGTCVAGATVTVRTAGGTTLCSATCTGAGTFECASGSTLPYGTNTVRATQVVSGVTSGPSPDRTFDVVPNPPTIISPTEGSVTADRQPTISGGCVPGARVTVREGATVLCSDVVCTGSGTSGSYSCTPPVLSYGEHAITATQTVSGRTSANSPTRRFRVVQCTASANCGGATPICNTSTNTCVACTSASHCNDGNPCTTDACSASNTCSNTTVPAGTMCPGGVCSGASQMCVQCTTNAHCGGGATPICNTSTNSCVACTSASHCNDGNPCTTDACSASNTCSNTTVPAGTMCPGGVCSGASQMCVQCVSDAQCGGATPVCNTSTNSCVACTSASHCNDGNPCTTDACSASNTCSNTTVPAGTMCPGGVCSGASQMCVQCVSDAQCSAPLRCDTSANVCVGCVTNAHCDDGNECTTNTCSAGGCSTVARAPGSSCSLGVCTPAATCAPVTVDIETPTEGTTVGTSTPTITGTGTPGTTVTVTIDGETVGTTTVDEDGTWSVPVTTPLPEGSHTVTATVDTTNGTDMDMTTFTVDTETHVSITTPEDGGTTYERRPRITGTGEPGATVVVTVDGEEIGTVTVGPDGTWTLRVPENLPDGEYTVEVTATDPVGNTATDTSTFTVDVGTEVIITTPADESVTNDSTPTITGTAEPGVTVVVTIEVDGEVVEIGTTTAGEDGTWSVPVTTPLPEGSHTVTATGTDPDGNVGIDTTTFTVDTETTVTITGVDPTTGVITGTGEPGATVVVTVDGVPVGTTTVDEDGTWVVEIDPLGPGTHTVTATGTDPAGNTDSDTTTVTVPATDGGVVAPDGGPSADGGVEPAPRRQGRYSGGALCATGTPAGESDPSAPWLLAGVALALAWRRRR